VGTLVAMLKPLKMSTMKNLVYILLLSSIFSTAQCWQSVDAGVDHTLAIKNDGTLWSWGSNAYYKLGYDTGAILISYFPQQIGNSNWQSVSSGTSHSSGIKIDGTLWTWGSIYADMATSFITPIQVGSDNNWKSVSCGKNTTIAIKYDGTLWNIIPVSNSYSSPSSMIQIGTDTIWKEVSANAYNGSNYFIGLKTDGTVWAWGSRYFNNSTSTNPASFNSTIPVQISLENDWSKISEKSAIMTMMIKNNGTLWYWGVSENAGTGSTPSFFQIGIDSNWSKVNTFGHSLALKTDGTLWGWGGNFYGELTDLTSYLSPSQIGSSNNWIDISVGGAFSCIVNSNNLLYTFGYNALAQLGNGTTNNTNIPTQVNCEPLSVENFSNNSFIVYPNPAKDFIKIEKNNNLLIDEFIVIDIYGKVVINQKNLNDKLNIQQLPNGIYLLQIICQNRKFNYKFIKE
jgi:hypothetical protein